MLEPFYSRGGITIYVGDNREVLPQLDTKVHAVCTDPPYGLSFMGKGWDHQVPGVEFWQAISAAMLPGAHLLAFGGTRTYHRMAVAIEDAGYEIRDTLQWLYGSGFPKSHDVSKAIDKMMPRMGMFTAFAAHFAERRAASGLTQKAIAQHFPSKTGGMTGCVWNWENGANVPTVEQWHVLRPMLDLSDEWAPLIERVEAEREVIGKSAHKSGIGNAVKGHYTVGGTIAEHVDITAPATPEAEQWQGWGTSLKPSYEPVLYCQKPHTYEGERDIIVVNLERLEAQLWSLLPANIAEKSFKLSPAEHGAACASARWTADERRNTLAGLFDQTDTPQFVSAMTTSLNIVISWRNTLAELWSDTSTFTTETATSQTIDLTTLKSLLSPLTPRTIIQAAMQPHGSTLSALPVARYFSAVARSMNATRELSALASATSTASETNLRPNHEPIIMARSPFKGTVAANVLAHGTGAINVDACRIGTDTVGWQGAGRHGDSPTAGASRGGTQGGYNYADGEPRPATGRWPANVILDEEVALQMGEPARYFYCAKSSRRERNAGLEGMPEKMLRWSAGDQNPGSFQSEGTNRSAQNHHPTVKPLALMRYLIQMVTPPGGIVLDPFAGSGSTLVAAAELGFHAIGIELSEEYAEIAARRVDHALNEREKRLPGLEALS